MKYLFDLSLSYAHAFAGIFEKMGVAT
jgi:hypothetical protein